MLLITLLSIAVLCWNCFLARPQERPIAALLAFSATYYSLGGLWYWVNLRNGIFTGVAWGDSFLLTSAAIISGSTAALCTLIVGITRTRSHQREFAFPLLNGQRGGSTTTYYALLIIGIAASLFVLAKGSFADTRDVAERGPLFLIAYQFSDVLIAVILYRIATRGFDTQSILIVSFFVVYAVLVGFRYKLALVGLPIMFMVLYSPISIFRKILITATAGVSALALFSAMTLFRVKFGAPDLSRHIADPVAGMLYGFFAETNILFGMMSIMEANVKPGNLFPFQPIIDIFLEYIPRAILPDKSTGDYLTSMRWGLLTKDGFNSKTAYPWIGEFFIMFGWLGIVVGPVTLAALFVWIKEKIQKIPCTQRQFTMGVFILTTLLGYYHFSRGYIPQITKSYIFVLTPYFMLCLTSVRQRLPQPHRQARRNFNSGPNESTR